MLVSPLTDGARGETATGELRMELESPLPRSLPTDCATAIFCAGVCFHPQHAVEFELIVDGRRHRPIATRMPRPDVLAADGRQRSYRSGWWTTVQLRTQSQTGRLELLAAVRIAGKQEVLVSLGAIDVLDRVAPPREPAVSRETIAVCMGTFDPDPDLLSIQVDSLREQTDERWLCLISDDCSEPSRFEQIVATVGEDERFVVSRSERRLGFYRNFERALSLVPAGVELIALCDQDDRWHPDKLARLRAALGDGVMVYSDQRLTDAAGRVLRDTMWRGRRNNHTNLASLLIANTITGAATLFRREVADRALPFPDTPGLQFHDHWLALVALASGEVRYVDEALYDYVQHAGAVFGEVTSDQASAASLHQPASSRGARANPPRVSRERRWRAAYFCGWLGREVQSQALLVRCADRLSPPKRRALERFISSQRSPAAFAWLALRPLRRLLGATETLGSELDLVAGIVWRWLIAVCARFSPRRQCDATYPNPLDFEQTRLRRWRGRM